MDLTRGKPGSKTAKSKWQHVQVSANQQEFAKQPLQTRTNDSVNGETGRTERAEQRKTEQFSGVQHSWSITEEPGAKHSSVQANNTSAFQIFRAACLHSRNSCLRLTSTKLHHIMKEESLICQSVGSSLLLSRQAKNTKRSLVINRTTRPECAVVMRWRYVALMGRSQLCSSFSCGASGSKMWTAPDRLG